ncbi:hypothetical protein VP01_8412g2, partial [Puccinia sorghi]
GGSRGCACGGLPSRRGRFQGTPSKLSQRADGLVSSADEPVSKRSTNQQRSLKPKHEPMRTREICSETELWIPSLPNLPPRWAAPRYPQPPMMTTMGKVATEHDGVWDLRPLKEVLGGLQRNSQLYGSDDNTTRSLGFI